MAKVMPAGVNRLLYFADISPVVACPNIFVFAKALAPIINK